MGYLTISTNVSCYQTHCQQQYYLPFSNTAHACTSAWCAQHCSTAAAQNATSFLLTYGPNRSELNWTDYKIYGVYSSVNELQVNKTEEIKQRLVEVWKDSNAFVWKHAIFVFLCSPGSAEALVRWGGKIKHHLTAYLLIYISAEKKLSKSVDVRRSYNKPKQCRFLRHGVVSMSAFSDHKCCWFT